MIGDLCCVTGKWKTIPFYIWLNKVREVAMLKSQNWLVISFVDDPFKLAEDNEFIHHLWLSVLSPACTQDNSILEWRVLKSSDKSNITGESHFMMIIQRSSLCTFIPVSNWLRTQIGEEQDKKQFLSSDISIFQPLGCLVTSGAKKKRGEEIGIGVFLSLVCRHFFCFSRSRLFIFD